MLGWEVNLDVPDHPRGWKMIFACPEPKHKYYCHHFDIWAKQTHFTARTLARIAGIMQWLTTAFPVGRAYVAPVLAARTLAEKEQASRTAD